MIYLHINAARSSRTKSCTQPSCCAGFATDATLSPAPLGLSLAYRQACQLRLPKGRYVAAGECLGVLKRLRRRAFPVANSLCLRTARLCDYSAPPPSPNDSTLVELLDKIAHLEERLSSAENFSNSSSCASSPALLELQASNWRGTSTFSAGSRSSDHGQSSTSSPMTYMGPPPTASDGTSGWAEGFPYVHQGLALPLPIDFCMPAFPTSVLLDPRLSEAYGPFGSRTTCVVPMNVLNSLGDGSSIQSTITQYFDTVNSWLPMVSKRYLHGGYWCRESDASFLLLSMQLITSSRAEIELDGSSEVARFYTQARAANSTIYGTARHFASQLEHDGVVSIRYLQGLVLLALYEYGHGIMPAAWITIGRCVRYADLLRLNPGGNKVGILGASSTWTEAEERRRTWWAVYIVEKMIGVAFDGTLTCRGGVCSEPTPRTPFPCEDLLWESGEMVPSSEARLALAPYSDPQSPFARLCQAAMLASRVLRQTCHEREPEWKNDDDAESGVAQLMVTIQELDDALAAESATSRLGFLGLTAAKILVLDSRLSLLRLSEEKHHACVAVAINMGMSSSAAEEHFVTIDPTQELEKTAAQFTDRLVYVGVST
ncbi:uncharacterized protein B0I36DRAFT_408668 [Microdochium trichocladiopsis]|uniref:Xylanolytic transcriptional activator regulatory domain-containing protein n=1 Tax=Microdochium trichocladiopsis TaxID=1682393 RepID=A0A9P8Y5D7_9PEZI|nr:uncharacterized protein B0I36DRAFT_408668 [Microdochium trichocladiopsis]KAH7030594.1 hypothetical protein B0I36DRAFT_408668 [Microdochium trichocladiopsis]